MSISSCLQEDSRQDCSIARNPNFVMDEVELHRHRATEAAALRGISVMHEASGIDFSLYREQTVHRRILRRLGLRNIRSLEAHARTVRHHPEERGLQRDLLICVTSFFRHPEAFETLSHLVFPAIVRGRPEGKVIVSGRLAAPPERRLTQSPLHCSITSKEVGANFPVQIFRLRCERSVDRQGPQRNIPRKHRV